MHSANLLRTLAGLTAAIIVMSAFGCSALNDSEAESEPEYGVVHAPLSPYCNITVQGKGTFDLESEYLPAVVACENGTADPEALKAQAIAARSVAYYTLDNNIPIQDSTGVQVFSCGVQPKKKHKDAVKATKGQVLRYKGVQIYGFYVAGATPNSTNCIPSPNTPSAGDTEKYVTYNWNKTGANVIKTPLGSLTSPQNRGCMSQEGSICLDKKKWKHKNILKFYYGKDIEIVTAAGQCLNESTCTPHCDGTVGISADCTEGDCGAFGTVCVMENGAPICAVNNCFPKCEGSVITYADCSTGDCGVFGLNCTINNGVPECTEKTCLPHCEGTVAIDANCVPGDCGVFGAGCTMKNGLPTCVSPECVNPPTVPLCKDKKAYLCDSQGLLSEVSTPPEICDGEDNDCDGKTDEGVKNACGTCGPTTTPETCDGIDNNCNGQIDEGVKNACNACGPTTTPETCDGVDNNCNGQIDEGVKNACNACGPTTTPEICDYKDNNCNGQIDEGVINACGTCGPTNTPETCDGVDNNCNGQTDEGVKNACGSCGPLPTEKCDSVDNDCNGKTDDGFDVGAPCTVTLDDCTVDGQKVCTANGKSTTCNADTTPCKEDPPGEDTGSPPPDEDTGSPPPNEDTGSPPPDEDTGSPPPGEDTGAPPPDKDTASPPPGEDTGETPSGDTGSTADDTTSTPVPLDATTDSGLATPPATPKGGGDGGCSVGDSQSPMSGGWLLVIWVLLTTIIRFSARREWTRA
jgi:hypothetical protein